MNQHLWTFGTGKNITSRELLELCKDIEGITFHGGEPLDQSEGVLSAIKLIKGAGKTVVLFTGYRYKELTLSAQKQAWKLADLVISGRYVEEKRNIYLHFRGSTNQRVYRHKGKYKNYQIKDGESVAIIRINDSGEMQSRGFRTEELEQLLNEISKENK